MAAQPTQPKRSKQPTLARSLAAIAEMWGFTMPDDLALVWEVACALDARHPLSVFRETIGVSLEGPFAVLAGGKPEKNLGRWTSDPPEFFSIAGGDSDGLHWGYVVHEPGKSEPLCAHFYSRDAWPISLDGTFFSALDERLSDVRSELAEELEESVAIDEPDKEIEKSIAAIDGQLRVFAKFKKRAAARPKSPKQTASTLDGIGVVCAPRVFSKPLVADDKLWKELRDSTKRTRHLVHARKLIGDGKAGGALKIARDLYAVLPEKELSVAVTLLGEVYAALDRPTLAKAIADIVPMKALPKPNARATSKATSKAKPKAGVKPKATKPFFADGLEEALENLGAVEGFTIDYRSADKRVPSRAQWRRMKRLSYLTLRGLKLPELPIEGFRLDSLELFQCKLAKFPPALTKMPTLTELTLNGLDLAFPSKLSFPNLERLALAKVDGGLRKIPPFVLAAKKLYNLSLYYNRIDEVPRELGNLVELRYLNLQDNKIKELPDVFDRLHKLDSLWLSNNLLKRLPDSIGALRKTLKSLSLDKNPLVKDSAERARIKQLLPKTKIYWT